MTMMSDKDASKLSRNQLIDAMSTGKITGDQFKRYFDTSGGEEFSMTATVPKVKRNPKTKAVEVKGTVYAMVPKPKAYVPGGENPDWGSKCIVKLKQGWPMTAYKDVILDLLDRADAIRQAIKDNDDKLASSAYAALAHEFSTKDLTAEDKEAIDWVEPAAKS